MPDDSTEDLDSLCRAIGYIVLQWGSNEQSLDLIVTVLFHGHGGKEHAEQNLLPRQLKRKIKFVRRCFARAPWLDDLKAEANAIMDDYQTLSKKRHDLVHGAQGAFDRQATGDFHFLKLDAEGEYHVLSEFMFNPDDFPEVTRDLLSLGRRANSLCRRLIDATERR